MRILIWPLLALAAATALAACGGATPTEMTAAPTPVATAGAELATPVSRIATVVAGAFAPPIVLTPTIVMTPTVTPTPGTPTATPTPAPSASLLRAAAALQEQVDAFREATAARDKEAVLRTQRELLDALPKAEMAAADDKSKAAEKFRSALRDLRVVLGGDLTKLDSAAKGIAEVTGGSTRQQQATATAGTATSGQPIANLGKYAKDLADQVGAFRKAQDQGNIGDLLRLQKSLLDEIDRGDAALKNARSKQGDTVRGALEDLRNALAGDGVKFESAQTKLLQVAEGASGDGVTKTTATTKQVDLQPLANALSNKLNAYQHALENKNQDEIAQTRQALADQVGKVQEAIKDDQSSRTAKLRNVLGVLREAAAGDQAKIDVAKNGLDAVMSGQ